MPEYRPIPGYENSYTITHDGVVTSLPRQFKMHTGFIGRVKKCILKTKRNEQGEPTVQLCRNSKHSVYTVKSLIKEAFNYE